MTPDVSVVVATHNRAARLRALLDALAAQEGVTHEAIVVDDASTDSTPEVLARAVEACRCALCAGQNALVPARHATQVGAKHAHRSLPLPTTTVLPRPPGWLRWWRLIASVPVRCCRAERGPTRTSWHARTRSRAASSSRASSPNFPTCNMAYPRACWSASAASTSTFATTPRTPIWPGARSRAAPVPSSCPGRWCTTRFTRRARSRSCAIPSAGSTPCAPSRRHPGMREAFTHRIFWRPSHEGLLLALAGWRPAPPLTRTLAAAGDSLSAPSAQPPRNGAGHAGGAAGARGARRRRGGGDGAGECAVSDVRAVTSRQSIVDSRQCLSSRS